MKNIHLVCNAHLDPVWLWEWEEGAAEAISTFRVAADFCEEYEGFVFNHNEVILYQWIEEYEPALFERIKALVQAGKWHIMGGWYLQPDCNMPSGESMVRQILAGRKYFLEKFHVMPSTAMNVDPFGHSRGMVQILAKAGFDSYIVGRPYPNELPLPAEDFTWVGLDGSKIAVHRLFSGYLSLRGQAHSKVGWWIDGNKDRETSMIFWGIGNHGGGPSRVDMKNLEELAQKQEEFHIFHSTPEQYFAEVKERGMELPEFRGSLNPCFTGCYTSQIRIKQKHRQLENALFLLEKMAGAAAMNNLMKYPRKELEDILRDLLTSEFHDILPGSSIQPVEEMSVRLLDHGLEIASRLKARAFFALAKGQPKAEEGEIPVLVYNPHPYKVRGNFEVEFQLPDQNWDGPYTQPVLYRNGERIPSQIEKEHSNLNLDWRKHMIFAAELEPSSMSRFDCKIVRLEARPVPHWEKTDGMLVFRNESMEAMINCSTGLLDRYRVHGVDVLEKNAFMPVVMTDTDDSWGTGVTKYRDVAGEFALMPPDKGTAFSGVRQGNLESVRVIEDGEVRTVVEALFCYQHSFLCLTYMLPKRGAELGVHVRVFWNEKSCMLKIRVPTVWRDVRYAGQTMFGVQPLPADGSESAAQKWTAAVSDERGMALTVINDCIYGSDFEEGTMHLTLLRSSPYAALTLGDRPLVVQDRFLPRMDQGERVFSFWMQAGEKTERLRQVDREALAYNEKPFALSFFPGGEGTEPQYRLQLTDSVVQMSAFKMAECSEDYIIRLFEPTGEERCTTLTIEALQISQEIHFNAFEIKTLRLHKESRRLVECDIIEDIMAM